MSDRKVKLQDPHPVHQKLLPRDDLRVKQLSILVSIAEVITRAVQIIWNSLKCCTHVETGVSTDCRPHLSPCLLFETVFSNRFFQNY